MSERATGPRVLVAPDKFKGTLSAADVAEAMASGLDRPVDRCPVADGGEGTAAILMATLGGAWCSARASDALGREIECRFALLGDGTTAAVEVAEASGLWRIARDQLDPLRASSRGTGELLAAARERGAKRILLACGGSATTDAGRGLLEAFDPSGGELTCLCDTDVAFLAAARLYSPQKGATPRQVGALEERLGRIAGELPRDPSRLPYAGAAGGLAGGLWAHGARLVAGAPYVLSLLDFDRRLSEASLLVTGEGSLDATSLRGKAVGEVARRAARAGVRCDAIVGVNALPAGGRSSLFASIQEAETAAAISAAAARLA